MEEREEKSSLEGIGCFVKWKERAWLKFLWTHWGICNCTSIITLSQLFCLNRPQLPLLRTVQYHDFLLDPCAGIVELQWVGFHNYDIRQNLRPSHPNLFVSNYALPIPVIPNVPKPNDFTTERPKMFNSTRRLHIRSPSPMTPEFIVSHRSSKNLHAAANYVLAFDRSTPSFHAPSPRSKVPS